MARTAKPASSKEKKPAGRNSSRANATKAAKTVGKIGSINRSVKSKSAAQSSIKTAGEIKTDNRSAKKGLIKPSNSATKTQTKATAAKAAESKKEKSSPLTAVKPSGTRDESFFELVYQVVRQIPKGKVTSYGAIARVLGTKLSARMVGWAMHGAPAKVPAHRVVNRNGMLSGKHHFATPTKMQELLEKEGIKVENDIIRDFKKHYWDPAEELA